MVEVKVFCENEHERVEMEMDHMHQRHICQRCGHAITPEAVDQSIPEAYRPHKTTFGRLLQEMLDYDISVIYNGRRLRIEYPRRAHRAHT